MARNPSSSPLLSHHNPQGTASWTEPSPPAIPGCKNSFWVISHPKDLKQTTTGSVQSTGEIWRHESNISSWSFGCNTVSKLWCELFQSPILILSHEEFCPPVAPLLASWNPNIWRCSSKASPFWDFWNTGSVFLPTAPGMQPSPSMYRCRATGDIQLFCHNHLHHSFMPQGITCSQGNHTSISSDCFPWKDDFLMLYSVPKQRNHIHKFFQFTFPSGAQQLWVSFRQLVPGMFFH